MSTVFFIFSKNFFLPAFLVYNAVFKARLLSCRFSAVYNAFPALFPLFYLFIIAIVFSARCVLSWCFCCRLQRVYNSCVSSFRLQYFRQSFRLYCFRGPFRGSVRNAGNKARKICFSFFGAPVCRGPCFRCFPGLARKICFSSGPCCRICFSLGARCAFFRAFRCFPNPSAFPFSFRASGPCRFFSRAPVVRVLYLCL